MKSLRRSLLPALGLLFVLAAPARADRFVPDTDFHPSPRWWAAELKFGPYKPEIDTEFGGGAKPYADTFGDGQRLMFQFGVDVQFLKLHGSLGVGAAFGYFGATGKALTSTGEQSGDETSLNVMPFILQLVYRWDYAAQKWQFPLVPYIRAGLVCAAWWVTNGAGNLAEFAPGRKAEGATFGYQINIGLAFLLDVLEPAAAKHMDMEMGINNSYLFVELVHNSIDDFGHAHSWQLGMKYSLLAGLTLEF